MKESFFYSCGKYYSIALSFIFFFLYSTQLPASDVGGIALVQAIIALLSIFSLQSIDVLIQRELAFKNYDASEIVSSAVLVKLVSCFVGVVTLICALSFLSLTKEIEVLVLLFSLSVFVNTFNFTSLILVVRGDYKKHFNTVLAFSTLSLIAKVGIFMWVPSSVSVVICFLVDAVFLSIPFLIQSMNHVRYRFSFNPYVVRTLLFEGKYLFVSGFLILVYSKIDQLMVSYFLGVNALADYSVALKFLSAFVVASSVFNLGFIKEAQINDLDYKKDCKNMLLLSLTLGTVFSLLNYFISPLCIEFLYGGKFPEASLYAQQLSIIVFFSFLLSSTGKILVLEGLSKSALERNIVSLFINLALNFLLIPILGVEGAIAATAISYMIGSFVYLLVKKSTRQVFLKVLM